METEIEEYLDSSNFSTAVIFKKSQGQLIKVSVY